MESHEQHQLHRDLGRVAAQIENLTKAVDDVKEMLADRFERVEADVLQLKLDAERARGRWAMASMGGGALVAGLVWFVEHVLLRG